MSNIKWNIDMLDELRETTLVVNTYRQSGDFSHDDAKLIREKDEAAIPGLTKLILAVAENQDLMKKFIGVIDGEFSIVNTSQLREYMKKKIK